MKQQIIFFLLCLQLELVFTNYAYFNPLMAYLKNPYLSYTPIHVPHAYASHAYAYPYLYHYRPSFIHPSQVQTSAIPSKHYPMYYWNGYQYIPFYAHKAKTVTPKVDAKVTDEHTKFIHDLKDLIAKLSPQKETGFLDRFGVAQVLNQNQIELLKSTGFDKLKPENAPVSVEFLKGYLSALDDIGKRINVSEAKLSEAALLAHSEEKKKETVNVQPASNVSTDSNTTNSNVVQNMLNFILGYIQTIEKEREMHQKAKEVQENVGSVNVRNSGAQETVPSHLDTAWPYVVSGGQNGNSVESGSHSEAHPRIHHKHIHN